MNGGETYTVPDEDEADYWAIRQFAHIVHTDRDCERLQRTSEPVPVMMTDWRRMCSVCSEDHEPTHRTCPTCGDDLDESGRCSFCESVDEEASL